MQLEQKYKGLRREESKLPDLMKIKNTRLFKEYRRIMAPLHLHKRLNKNITEFLNSSYIKRNIRKSSLSVTKSSVSPVNISRSRTPLGGLNMPQQSGSGLVNDLKVLIERKELKRRIQGKLKTLLHTSQGVLAQPKDSDDED